MRLRFARLRENQVGVRIRLDIEVHYKNRLGVSRRIQRVHVVHIVHATHLLFDWRCDGLLERLRIRTYIGGQDLNFRWRDVRELRDRQAENGDGADDAPSELKSPSRQSDD